MALGFAGVLGDLVENLDETAQPGYRRRLLEFHRNCEATLKGNIGVVHGTIAHGWHGPKQKRGYLTRPRILKESNFDPDLDTKHDSQGLICFARENRTLRDQLRGYARSRDDDSREIIGL